MFYFTDLGWIGLCQVNKFLAHIVIVGVGLRRVTWVDIVFHLTQRPLTADALDAKGLVELFQLRQAELSLDWTESTSWIRVKSLSTQCSNSSIARVQSSQIVVIHWQGNLLGSGRKSKQNDKMPA